jgi:hypothetical protein
MTQQNFEKKLAVLEAEGNLLRRFCHTRNPEELLKLIDEEIDRVKKATEELNLQSNFLNDTDSKS